MHDRLYLQLESFPIFIDISFRVDSINDVLDLALELIFLLLDSFPVPELELGVGHHFPPAFHKRLDGIIKYDRVGQYVLKYFLAVGLDICAVYYFMKVQLFRSYANVLCGLQLLRLFNEPTNVL